MMKKKEGDMGVFSNVSQAQTDSIFGLSAAFHADARAKKVNLSIGIYKTAELKTPIMEAVKEAERRIAETEKSKEYLPIDGDPECIKQSGLLLFGEALWSKRIYGCQGVGGTGALRIGGDFLKQEVGRRLYLSDPTWPNHTGVFTRSQMHVEAYPYYDPQRRHIDFDRLYTFLSGLQPLSIVLLHACCHNPTGVDLSLEQWRQLSALMQAKGLIPFFDCAYQGFGTGLEEDAAAVRLFAERGHEMLVAVSYSKNFGLYGERAGSLFIVTDSEETARRVGSTIKVIIRTNYSNPPLHGAKIVSTILSDGKLRKRWETELTSMRERIAAMRTALARALVAKGGPIDFRFLLDRTGMFSFCGLEKRQVDRLIKEYAIYMTGDGRINVAGLNWDHLDYVVDAITAVCR
jgi:aspartate/tyrosine/aromatic aminotransferase